MSKNPDDLAAAVGTDAEAKAEARSVEAAAIRRRWITLGEALAVIAVVISGLTLWNNWAERADTEATNRAQKQRTNLRSQTLVMTATSSDPHMLVLRATSSNQSIQAQTILFPRALSIPPVETTGEPRIEADWFAQALKKARDQAGMPDDSRGDERLPVVIRTTFLVDGRAMRMRRSTMSAIPSQAGGLRVTPSACVASPS